MIHLNARRAWDSEFATAKRTPLQSWLCTATRGLCPEAQTRITTEYTDHFQQTLESMLALGQSSPEAEQNALNAFGSPEKTRRQLLRTNLSTRESILITNITTSPPRLFLATILFTLLLLPHPLRTWLFHSNNSETLAGVDSVGTCMMISVFAPSLLGPGIYHYLAHGSIRRAASILAGIQLAIFAYIAARIVLDDFRPAVASLYTANAPDFQDLAAAVLADFTVLFLYAYFITLPALRLTQKLPRPQGPVQS